MLADLKADQITKLTIEKVSGKVALERDGDKKWKLIEPVRGVIDSDALQRLLDVLTAVPAEDFVHEGRDNLAEYGLDQPTATLTVVIGDKTDTLLLGKSQGPDKQYAFWSDPPLVFTIWASRANVLLRDVVTQPNAPAASAIVTNAPAAVVVPPPVSPAITTLPAVATVPADAPVKQ